MPARAVSRCARRHPVLAVLTLGYLAGFAVLGAVTGAPATPVYVGTVAVAVLLAAVADERVRLSTPVLAVLCGWGAAHMAGGLLDVGGGRVLYNVVVARWLHVDNAVHFAGFGAAGLAFWEALQRQLPRPTGRLTGWLTVWLAAMGVGAFNEVAEFAATHLLGAANVGGYQNTGRDLVANMLGGAVAGLLAGRYSRPPQPAA